MKEEVKQSHQPGFEKYMSIYAALRLITFVTGIIIIVNLNRYPVIWGVYLGRVLAFYWLMRGWKANAAHLFNYGFFLDTILSGLELWVWVVGFILIPPYVIYLLSSLPMFLVMIAPIIVWTVLLGAKLRY